MSIFDDILQGRPASAAKTNDALDDVRRTIGLLAARVKTLEEQNEALALAVVVLLNHDRDGKRSQALVPDKVAYGKVEVLVERKGRNTSDPDAPAHKSTLSIRLKVT